MADGIVPVTKIKPEPPSTSGHSENSNFSDALHRTSEDKVLKRRGYYLTKLLGEGSYAKVYYAEYANPDSEEERRGLACKVINGNEAPKDFLRRFFPREVEIMSRVNHQHLIRVHSILQRKNIYYLFMQYCENGDLLEFIRKHGAVKEKQARVWFCQILRGLNYLHERNIAHRDMKCENILLTHAYNIKISDFGFARHMLPGEINSETFCGSVSYASPEIIRGVPYEPKAADIWSIGVILYVMLNKAMPFDDTTLKLLYESQMARGWKFRSRLKDILSPEVKNFLYITMDPDPELRKTPTLLWREKWIQEGSEVDLSINGAPKLALNTKLMSKKEVKLREKLASDKKEKEILRDNAPVQIIEAETALVRNASYFLNEYKQESETIINTDEQTKTTILNDDGGEQVEKENDKPSTSKRNS